MGFGFGYFFVFCFLWLPNVAIDDRYSRRYEIQIQYESELLDFYGFAFFMLTFCFFDFYFLPFCFLDPCFGTVHASKGISRNPIRADALWTKFTFFGWKSSDDSW